MTRCYTTWAILRPHIRRLTQAIAKRFTHHVAGPGVGHTVSRHVARHAVKHGIHFKAAHLVAAGLTVCVGGTAGINWFYPPTIAKPVVARLAKSIDVPEPDALTLLLTGLSGALLVRRRARA
jgi:hypothetical protein